MPGLHQSVITYIGISISIIALLATIATYLISKYALFLHAILSYAALSQEVEGQGARAAVVAPVFLIAGSLSGICVCWN